MAGIIGRDPWITVRVVLKVRDHGRTQKILPAINVFHRGIQFASGVGSIPVFLRKRIGTCDFPWGVGSRPPVLPLDQSIGIIAIDLFP